MTHNSPPHPTEIIYPKNNAFFCTCVYNIYIYVYIILKNVSVTVEKNKDAYRH